MAMFTAVISGWRDSVAPTARYLGWHLLYSLTPSQAHVGEGIEAPLSGESMSVDDLLLIYFALISPVL